MPWATTVILTPRIVDFDSAQTGITKTLLWILSMPWPDLWADVPASSCCECWLLRTHSCSFLEKFPWDNNSFLALKVTPTHKAVEGQTVSTTKGQTLPCPKVRLTGGIYTAGLPIGLGRSQAPAKITSLLNYLLCLTLLPSLPLLTVFPR